MRTTVKPKETAALRLFCILTNPMEPSRGIGRGLFGAADNLCTYEAGASAAPKPRGKGFHPLHPNRRLYKLGKESKLRLTRWGYGKLDGFWPKESPGKSEGESTLSPADYSQAFPGCFASGLASKGRRARSTTVPRQTSAFLHAAAGICFLVPSRGFRRCGSREVTSLVGCGAKPHRSPGVLKCP